MNRALENGASQANCTAPRSPDPQGPQTQACPSDCRRGRQRAALNFALETERKDSIAMRERQRDHATGGNADTRGKLGGNTP